MNKLYFSFLSLFLCINISAQSLVKESLSFTSNLLNQEVKYSVYLPEDYTTSSRNYPVLYLFHGSGGDETAWIQMGDLKNITDKTIREGHAINMIIVLPNAKGTWFVNSFDGKTRYEDMFFNELIPHIEKTFRARKDKQYRAVSGLSMGGYGAFLYRSPPSRLFFSLCSIKCCC